MAISLPWPLQHAHRQMEVQRQTHQGRWPLASRWRLLTLTIRGQDSAASEPIASAYETFDDFIARREPDVFGYLWRLTGDEQLAYDLCQETFLRAWQHFEKIRHYEQPGAWLFRVATNLALNAIERRSAASGRVTPLRDDHPAVEDLSGRIAHLEVIHQTLLRLPTRERAALVLREVEGFSNSEIAHALDISANSVRMLLSRARAHFRQHYASDDREEESR